MVNNFTNTNHALLWTLKFQNTERTMTDVDENLGPDME
jgi:hypothetical protein